MATKSPLLSIIIVNYNGERFLGELLTSLFGQKTKKTFEVIVVDNGSTDGSVVLVRRDFPQAMVIENGENLGFAAGNNRGIAASRGKYILTLNTDTVAGEGFLEKLLAAAEGSEEDVGMWAPKILSLEDRSLVDSVGGLLVYPDGLAKGRGRLERDSGQFDRTEEVLMPSACAGLYRKRMLDEVGLFDEDFFMYCEDTDLGFRARLSGWRALSVPGAVVYHHYSGSGGRYTPMKAFFVERNHLWLALKVFPPSMLLTLPFYELWRYIVEVYGLVTKRGGGARMREDVPLSTIVSTVVRAYLSALRGLPRVFSKRKRVQTLRTIPAGHVRSLFRVYGLRARDFVLTD